MKSLTTLLLCLSISLISCQTEKDKTKTQHTSKNVTPIEVPLQNGMARAYFASGCFWCVEAVYESVKGVYEVINGYAGGYTDNPTYQSSNTGRTGHAEAVEVIYDPKVVSFLTLLDVYFGSQNTIQINGQGPDRGSQYRSIIFYQNDEQKKIIEEKIATCSFKSNIINDVSTYLDAYVNEALPKAQIEEAVKNKRATQLLFLETNYPAL